MVVSEIRRYMEAAVGRLSPAKARELATSLMHGEGKDQVAKAAQDLMDWSNRNRERLTDLVRTEVRSQLKQVGVASRDDVDALRRRVRDLEKAAGTRGTTPKRTAAKRATAKRATAKVPKGSTAPSSTTPTTGVATTAASA
jgi:polyhydroxyalkanoate synthesis regulator phasin